MQGREGPCTPLSSKKSSTRLPMQGPVLHMDAWMLEGHSRSLGVVADGSWTNEWMDVEGHRDVFLNSGLPRPSSH